MKSRLADEGFRVRATLLPRAALTFLVAAGAVTAFAAESDRAYCERQEDSARIACLRDLNQTPAKPVSPVTPSAAASHSATVAESDRAYCERQEDSAKVACLRDLNRAAAKPKATLAATPSSATGGGAAANANATPTAPGGALYTVVGGNHVDPQTLIGFQTWRAAACDRCHGANQEGLVGPSLVNSLKTLTKSDFVTTVTHGRLEKGMPSFAADKTVMSHLDQLYAYLKGRSDGAITKAHVLPIK